MEKEGSVRAEVMMITVYALSTSSIANDYAKLDLSLIALRFTDQKATRQFVAGFSVGKLSPTARQMLAATEA